MNEINTYRRSRNNNTASNSGYIGTYAPQNNEQHVNYGRFVVSKNQTNGRIYMKFVPNNPVNATSIMFRKKSPGDMEYAWKWPNMPNWSDWQKVQGHNHTLWPNLRPRPPGTPGR